MRHAFFVAVALSLIAIAVKFDLNLYTKFLFALIFILILNVVFDVNAVLFLMFDFLYKRTKSFKIKRFAYRTFYLNTKYWHDFSNRIIRENRFVCSRCGHRKPRYMLNVHHLSYLHLMNEKDYEVRVLCRQCHHFEHLEGFFNNEHVE